MSVNRDDDGSGEEEEEEEYDVEHTSREPPLRPEERHKTISGTANWLRAAVLGSNDAIVSVSALMIGVAANNDSTQSQVLLAALAALFAGATSMALGEYVSVSSQYDMEQSDLALERWEIQNNWDDEVKELAALYEKRGVKRETAMEVAKDLMKTEESALEAHANEELGIRDFTVAQPFSAAVASLFCFFVFGIIPILAGGFIQDKLIAIISITITSLIALVISGSVGAILGGAPWWKGAIRVGIGGSFAFAITAAVGWFSSQIGIT